MNVESPELSYLWENVSPAAVSNKLLQHVPVSSLPSIAKADGSLLRISYCSGTMFTSSRSLICCGSSRTGKRPLLKPISAVGSGLEASITNPEENVIGIKNFEIVVESKDDDKMQVRVDLSGKETGIVFEKVLRNFARTAPTIPGFAEERESTNKYSRNLPIMFFFFWVTSVLMCMVDSAGKLSTKENLTVKDNKINTIQTAEELKSAFIPGNGFGFNAILELEKSSKASTATLELEKSTVESS
ncbi:hypothetical protein ACS0TY_018561 [Phlomoides rotata]